MFSMRSDRPAHQRAAVAVVALALMACSDSLPTERAGPRTPATPQSILAAFEVTVDEQAGVTYRHLPRGGAPAGVNGQIYGTQGVDVRLYNDAVVVQPGALINSKTWSFNVGLQNLKSFAIGVNQNRTAPYDTMGVYVFFTQDPVTTLPNPCVGYCSSALFHFMGALPLTSPTPQNYYFWNERVAPHGTGGVGGDTTRVRRKFEFVTGTNVQNFRFNVLVSAAWPPPSAPNWKVYYTADSVLGQPRMFPDSANPAWKFANRIAPAADAQVANNRLRMTGLKYNMTQGQSFYFRRDSLVRNEKAYISADLFESAPAGLTPSTNPETMIALADTMKLVALGLASNRVGFVGNQFGFLTSTFADDIVSYAVNGTVPHNYTLVKYARDSAVFCVDGVRRGRITYSRLNADPYKVTSGTPLDGATALFGVRARTGGTTSIVDNVIYELGATIPCS